MNLVGAKLPSFIKSLYPNYIWDIKTKEKVLYLTFDDGPTPQVTQWVLNTLDQYHAKATFFLIGDNVRKYPDIPKSILKTGHSLGNHTFNHLKGWKTNTSTYLENCKKAEIELETYGSQNFKLFRPPYGKIKRAQGRKLMEQGYKIIMWDIITFDWDQRTSQEACLNHAIKHAKPGSIIVFHDSLKASKNMMYALPKTLEYFSQLGYRFESIKF